MGLDEDRDSDRERCTRTMIAMKRILFTDYCNYLLRREEPSRDDSRIYKNHPHQQLKFLE